MPTNACSGHSCHALISTNLSYMIAQLTTNAHETAACVIILMDFQQTRLCGIWQSAMRNLEQCVAMRELILFIVNPEGSMVQQNSTRNHFNTHVHHSDATLTRHIARFDAITTSCGVVTEQAAP